MFTWLVRGIRKCFPNLPGSKNYIQGTLTVLYSECAWRSPLAHINKKVWNHLIFTKMSWGLESALFFHWNFIKTFFFVLLCFHVPLERFSSKCCKTKAISRTLRELKESRLHFTQLAIPHALHISLPSRFCSTSRSTACERRILRHVINFIELTVTVTVLGVFVNKLKLISNRQMWSPLLKRKLGPSHLIQ